MLTTNDLKKIEDLLDYFNAEWEEDNSLDAIGIGTIEILRADGSVVGRLVAPQVGDFYTFRANGWPL